MGFLFCGCSSLIDLPDISKWNVNNVINMNGIFSDCCSLQKLPDITNWFNIKENNINKEEKPFYKGALIKEDDNIYAGYLKYNNTGKIFNYMFYNCSSLQEIPDISKWNIYKVVNIRGLFYGCSSLESLPDISKWNIDNVNDISEIFANCFSLKKIPDISIWNTNNVEHMNNIFSFCSSLISLPDISKWKTNNVIDMKNLFLGCSSLISIPNISKWDTNKIIDISGMFYGCTSLTKIPDISLWKFNNNININNLFTNCKSVIDYPDISKWNLNKDIVLKGNIFSPILNSDEYLIYKSETLTSNSAIDEILSLSNNQSQNPEQFISSNSKDNYIIKNNESFDDKNVINFKFVNDNEFLTQDDKLNDYYENFYN